MNNLVDVAAVGTQQRHVIGSETQILREAGILGLQHKAGYVPATMPPETPAHLPVTDDYAACADAMMTRFCGQEVMGTNPRVPYLIVIWLLVGKDNPFRICRLAPRRLVVPQLAWFLLCVACGYEPSERKAIMSLIETDNQTSVTISYGGLKHDPIATALLRAAGLVNAKRTQIAWAAWLSSSMVSELGKFDEKHFDGKYVEATVWEQARLWCYLSDDELGDIIRRLFIATLDSKLISPQT